MDLDPLEGGVAGVLVSPENPLRRAVVNERVAHHETVGVQVEAARAAAGELDVLEHGVIPLQLDRVRAPGEHRATRAGAADGDWGAGGAVLLEPDAAGVGVVPVQQDDVARAENVVDRL